MENTEIHLKLSELVDIKVLNWKMQNWQTHAVYVVADVSTK